MKKILLVFEDYSDLTATEVYLKKVGFDVIGVSNELLISEQIITFRPDVVVGSGKSHRVNSLSIGQRLKESSKFTGKSVIIFPQSYKPNNSDLAKMKIDAVLEEPVHPHKLIQTLAKLCQIPHEPLLDKFKRATASDPVFKEKMSAMAGKVGIPIEEATPAKTTKEDKYSKFVQGLNMDVHSTTFSRNDVKSRQSELKKDWDFKELEQIDALKREFVDALFKKKPQA
jgi:hypothetical protein